MHSIKTKILPLTMGAVILVFSVTAVISFYYQRRAVNAAARLQSANKSLNMNILFNAIEHNAMLLGRSILDNVTENDAALSAMMGSMVQMTIGVISVSYYRENDGLSLVVSEDGNGGYKTVRERNIHGKAGCEEAIKAQKGVWIDNDADDKDKHIVVYATPVFQEENIVAVLAMLVDISFLQNLVTFVHGGQNASIKDTNGDIVYHKSYPSGLRNVAFSDERTAVDRYFVAEGVGGKRMSIYMALLFVLALCIAAGLTIRVLTFIITPVAELTAASYKIARGELKTKIRYQSDNELGILADSIRKTASQLQQYIDFIRKAAREESETLRAAKKLAEDASRAKSDFLASMSHEIRTPINAVLGMDEMILRETDSSDIRQYAVNIKNAGNTLLTIINDILDFSKIEAGKMELIPDRYDLCFLLVDLVNMIDERAQRKGLELIVKADPAIPQFLIGDCVRIKQCILNILTNAVKYTREGTVTFSVSYTKKDENSIVLSVSVKDTGIGIKKEDMVRLYSPFERIEESRNRTIEGTGLGMSIVQKTLALMNTRLEVQSEYGVGSEFSFAVEQQVADWMAMGDIKEAYRKSVESMGKYEEKLHAPCSHLLFVDDTEMNLLVIKGLLKNTGIHVDTAASGKETLEKVCVYDYDIIFIDHRMPDMDGIQTLQTMSQLEANRNRGKPVVALTANAISGAKDMYLNAGFTDYLTKPVVPMELERMIRKYLPSELIEEDAENAAVIVQNEGAAFSNIEGIDTKLALANCGDTEVLKNALTAFVDSIEEDAAKLSGFVKAGNILDFRVKVHALKSTARLIGADELSNQAAYLEACADKNDLPAIQEKVDTLLALYMSYKAKLSAFSRAATEASPGKELATDEILQEAFALLAKYADDFNIDGADGVVAVLEKYAMPTSFEEVFIKLKQYVNAADFTKLSELLAKIKF